MDKPIMEMSTEEDDQRVVRAAGRDVVAMEQLLVQGARWADPLHPSSVADRPGADHRRRGHPPGNLKAAFVQMATLEVVTTRASPAG
jgi:hypothetical protein